MMLQRLMDKVGKSDVKGNIFRSKDTLAMALPSVVDLSVYTILYQTVNDAARNKIRYLLLDLSEAENLCDSGIAAFICLQKLINQQHVRLLMLDTPTDIHNRLEPVLPDAFWIDMSQKDVENNSDPLQGVISKAH